MSIRLLRLCTRYQYPLSSHSCRGRKGRILLLAPRYGKATFFECCLRVHNTQRSPASSPAPGLGVRGRWALAGVLSLWLESSSGRNDISYSVAIFCKKAIWQWSEYQVLCVCVSPSFSCLFSSLYAENEDRMKIMEERRKSQEKGFYLFRSMSFSC